MANGQFSWQGFDYDAMAGALAKAFPNLNTTQVTPNTGTPNTSGTGGGTPQTNASGGGAPSGTGTGSVSGTGTNTTSGGTDAAGAAITAADGATQAITATTANVLKQLNSISDTFDGTIFAKIQQGYGMLNESFSDLEGFSKSADSFAANEVKNALVLQKSYFDTNSKLQDYFKDSKEFLDMSYQMTQTMAESNYRTLASFDAEERERAALFQKNLDIAGADVSELLSRTYAESGDTSDKILQDITAHATHMSKVSGMSMKDLAGEMAAIMKQTDTFGFKTAEQASRIAATYKQLGLDLQTFSTLVGNFRDFDSAAQKMGDLSAMFGVQMDAMEMMYLANEDEEQFLHRMREQMIDKGVDVDKMSNTRLRALGEQMNMSQEQLKTFFREGELIADQTDQQQASAEANQMGLKETQKVIEGMKLPITRTQEEFADLFKAEEVAAKTQELAKLRVEAGKLNSEIAKGVREVDLKDLGIDRMFEMALKEAASGIGKIRKQAVEAGGFKDLMKESLDPAKIQASFDAITEKAATAAKATGKEYKKGFDEYFKPESPPKAMDALNDLYKWMGSDMPADFKVAAEKTAKEFGTGMSEEMITASELMRDTASQMVLDYDKSVADKFGLSKDAFSELVHLAGEDHKKFAERAKAFGLDHKEALREVQKANKHAMETYTRYEEEAAKMEGRTQLTTAEKIQAAERAKAEAAKENTTASPEGMPKTSADFVKLFAEREKSKAAEVEKAAKEKKEAAEKEGKSASETVEKVAAENKILAGKIDALISALGKAKMQIPVVVALDKNGKEAIARAAVTTPIFNDPRLSED